jgi:hypothetical protein
VVGTVAVGNLVEPSHLSAVAAKASPDLPRDRPSGTRVRKRVMARTKTEVREKLKELHQQAENGVRPRRHYTVNDALDDWLETGLDGWRLRP